MFPIFVFLFLIFSEYTLALDVSQHGSAKLVNISLSDMSTAEDGPMYYYICWEPASVYMASIADAYQAANYLRGLNTDCVVERPKGSSKEARIVMWTNGYAAATLVLRSKYPHIYRASWKCPDVGEMMISALDNYSRREHCNQAIFKNYAWLRLDLPNCPGVHDGDLSNSDSNIKTEFGGAVEIHRPDCDYCSFQQDHFNNPCV